MVSNTPLDIPLPFSWGIYFIDPKEVCSKEPWDLSCFTADSFVSSILSLNVYIVNLLLLNAGLVTVKTLLEIRYGYFAGKIFYRLPRYAGSICRRFIEDVRNLHKTLARMNFSNLIGVLATLKFKVPRNSKAFENGMERFCVSFWSCCHYP